MELLLISSNILSNKNKKLEREKKEKVILKMFYETYIMCGCWLMQLRMEKSFFPLAIPCHVCLHIQGCPLFLWFIPLYMIRSDKPLLSRKEWAFDLTLAASSSPFYSIGEATDVPRSERKTWCRKWLPTMFLSVSRGRGLYGCSSYAWDMNIFPAALIIKINDISARLMSEKQARVWWSE